MINQQIVCPHCKSNDTVKRGFIAKSKKQRYFCKACKRKFIERNGFYRMKNTPQKITLCLDLFYRGISTRKIQEHLKAFYPHNSSNVTIYNWVLKYSKMISAYTDSLPLKVGEEMQMDEMEYHRRLSRNSKGIDRNWFIDTIDCRTRFMVASNYVQNRGQEELKRVIMKAKDKTENQVKTVTTDGLLHYPFIIKKVYGWDKKLRQYNVTHHRVTAIKGEGFNIMIERLHNNIRARTKTMRGFHGSVSSANAIMKGFEVYYNFITEHQAIGKCPYELATDLKLNSENKWLELIQMSNRCI